MRLMSLVPLCSVLALSACGGGPTEAQKEIFKLPEADLSTARIDFGEVAWGDSTNRLVNLTNDGDLAMGVASIALLDEGMQDNFALVFGAADIVCPDQAAAKDVAIDTGTSGGDDSGSGAGGDTGTGGTTSDDVLVLDPGCTLPIRVKFAPTRSGEVRAAFAVHTVTDTADDPTYYRDPDQFNKVVLLQGSSSKDEGNIVVKSPNMDLGHHYTGEVAVDRVEVHNVGGGALQLSTPTLAESCDEAFTIDPSAYPSDGVLPGGESTYVTVTFTPVDLDPAYCSMVVPSDDADSPEVTVNLRGNVGADPENKVPTVVVRSPQPGYQHNSTEPLTLELNIFDENQPANTVYCKVRSLLADAKIVDCTPTDESGHVFVEIPTDLLEQGTDTLKVEVTDQSENRAWDSTTVLWKATYPDSDDDGDGWGDDDPTSEYYDCDDNDVDVYPYAAEIYDGKDNDCDGGIDENTTGSDDDGDSVSEIEGDCDDTDPDTYPNAPEQADQKDNDCDGVVDEGTTLYDDDGDGFSEADLDCDDSDPDINPAAVEVCDGIDNNCNGLKDYQEGCVEIDSEPMIVGGIQMSHTAIGVGESTTMTVEVYEADGQDISYSWSEDADLTSTGFTAIDNPGAQTITWTAPDALPDGSTGETYAVYVVVMDPDGNQDWAFDEIWVYPESVALTHEKIILDNTSSSGCFGGSTTATGLDTGAAASLLPVFSIFGLFAMARRRREDDE